MDVARLASLVARPDLHRKVLRGYTGPYALGVTRLNRDDQAAALRLRVTGGNETDFPSEVELEGEMIPLLVDVHWTAPSPQKAATSVE